MTRNAARHDDDDDERANERASEGTRENATAALDCAALTLSLCVIVNSFHNNKLFSLFIRSIDRLERRRLKLYDRRGFCFFLFVATATIMTARMQTTATAKEDKKQKVCNLHLSAFLYYYYNKADEA